MLTSWFGATEAHSDTEHQDLSTDGTLKTVDISTRRTEQEVLKLVRTFQRVFDESPTLQQRIAYFWPATEFFDRILFTLARDVPKAKNPLWPHDPNEVFPDDHYEPKLDAPRADVEEESSDDSFDRVLGKTGGRRPRKKRAVPVQPKCVEWLGFLNERNGFAAIKIRIPATHEPWITWTNRLVVFLFADIPGYEVPEDFIQLLQPPTGGPFNMRCQNPRCIRLSHINYLPLALLSTLKPAIDVTEPTQPIRPDQRSTSALPSSSHSLYPPSNTLTSHTSTISQELRNSGSQLPEDQHYRPVTSFRQLEKPLSRRRHDAPGGQADKQPYVKTATTVTQGSESETEDMVYPDHHAMQKRPVWSPGFT